MKSCFSLCIIRQKVAKCNIFTTYFGCNRKKDGPLKADHPDFSKKYCLKEDRKERREKPLMGFSRFQSEVFKG